VIVGFTGTRHGTALAQHQALVEQLWLLNMTKSADVWFHHGDCIGADAEAHAVALDLGYSVCGHPPLGGHGLRAYSKGFRVLCKHAPPLERNHDIVNACDVLLAAPRRFKEELRSGTWATIRYARKLGKPVTIIFPDGSITKERQPQ